MFKSFLIKKSFPSIDAHTLEVLKNSGASVIVKVCGMISTFIISLLIGRSLGASGLGIINLTNQIISVAIVFATIGLNNVVLKEVSISFERKDWENVSNSVYTALLLCVPFSIFISSGMILSSNWISESFFKEEFIKYPLIIAASVVIFQVVSRIIASSVNGLGKVWQSNLVSDTLSSFLVMGFILLLNINKFKLDVVLVAILFAISRIIVSIVFWTYWKYIYRQKSPITFKSNEMLKVSIPLFIVSSSTLIITNSDSIMIGWLSSVKEVGLYSVGAKLGLLTNFFLVITNSSLAPKIASLYASNKNIELSVMLKKITIGLMLLGLINLLFFIFFGKFILGMWGGEFVASYEILLIICFGQLINIGTGATGLILMMTGNEKILGKITFMSAILNVSLNFLLIPQFGGVGAAISSCITFLIDNSLKIIYVKKKTGIVTIPFIN